MKQSFTSMAPSLLGHGIRIGSAYMDDVQALLAMKIGRCIVAAANARAVIPIVTLGRPEILNARTGFDQCAIDAEMLREGSLQTSGFSRIPIGQLVFHHTA